MFKDKLRLVGDFILKNDKVIYPVAGVLAVAITVSAALGAVGSRRVEDIVPETGSSAPLTADISGDIPLVNNEDAAISELIYTYYNAQALGDLETLKSLCDEISDLDLLSFEEKANYIDYYPSLEIYTKKGLNEGETIVYVYYRMTFVNHEEEFPGYTSHYVCTAEDGSLYIKRGNFSDELNNYTSMLCAQDDVVEFNNRVIAEYDAFKEAHPELASYPEEVMTQVNMTVGVRWATMQSAAEGSSAEGTSAEDASSGDVNEGNAGEGVEPMYAIATTTVNVRSSDSQQADRLGKVTEGTRLKVVEVRPNGWSKVLFENKEGYIKSEFLQMEDAVGGEQSAEGVESTGTVTATTNVNVRAEANETANKLGKLLGGESVELIATEGDWCKIKFNGQIGYVKAEFVQ